MTRSDAPTIRSAVLADAPALLAIYRPFIEATIVSFENNVLPILYLKPCGRIQSL